jgi:hypothetical protein
MLNTKTASLTQLKAFCLENNIAVDGDRRCKQSYIEAIELWELDNLDSTQLQAAFDAVKTDLVNFDIALNGDGEVVVIDTASSPIPSPNSCVLVAQIFLVAIAIFIGLAIAVIELVVKIVHWFLPVKQADFYQQVKDLLCVESSDRYLDRYAAI